MIYQIRHRITYRYVQPVIIEPMTIRLRPRDDGDQRILQWSCRISPVPLASTEILDIFGNSAVQVSVSGVHLELTVETNCNVECSRGNPFDYLSLDSKVNDLPASYGDRTTLALAANLRRNKPEPEIDAWAAKIAAKMGQKTQPFLLHLTELINREFVTETRYDGAPHGPLETLSSQRGACRDLAVLFMDACRSQGIATRFVSGYVYEPNRTHGSELHAWAEVYIPGGGWRGYDPTLGIAVSDGHIPVASGPEAEWAAPTEGCYIGTGTDSTIDYEVSVKKIMPEMNF